ncbi:MAG: glutathione S-transferase family protein [Deltaproteobacteria bacterium]|nr:glutathione S-transferase family protein [Deltaproteobacteria bacterium]
MGLLVAGEWRDEWYDTEGNAGEFVRSEAGFRSWITPDGSAGPSGQGGFVAEPGRYRLYVSYACPWAHRTLLARALEGLEAIIPISVVHYLMGAEGWTFEPAEDVVPDPVLGATRLHQIYTAARADFTGRVTVPVLWDTQRETIVSNESSEILRMFDTAFDGLGARGLDLRPDDLHDEIDATNTLVYDAINNGVYKAGFATRQAVYERHVHRLFDVLDQLEERLGRRRWLCGERFTEADVRLFPTLLRFDPVYHGHFKCNLRRIQDYPHLSGYVRDVFQLPGVAETIRMEHVVRHYYGSHDSINPTRIVPIYRGEDLSSPHGREALGESPLS